HPPLQRRLRGDPSGGDGTAAGFQIERRTAPLSTIIHERPGVYSSYDASTVVRSGVGSKVVGIAAQSEKGAVDAVTLLTSYAAGVTAFGETGAMTPLLRLLFLNGATAVKAVRV